MPWQITVSRAPNKKKEPAVGAAGLRHFFDLWVRLQYRISVDHGVTGYRQWRQRNWNSRPKSIAARLVTVGRLHSFLAACRIFFHSPGAGVMKKAELTEKRSKLDGRMSAISLETLSASRCLRRLAVAM